MQLLLGAPFAPASSGAEVLLDVIDELRAAVANATGGAEVASGEPAADGPLCWRAVARLPLRTLCTALGAVEAHVYEAEAEALEAWVQGRGAALNSEPDNNRSSCAAVGAAQSGKGSSGAWLSQS